MKDTFKENGYFWHGKKTMWYFKPKSDAKRYGKKMSMDDIRFKYGSKTVKSKNKRGEICS